MSWTQKHIDILKEWKAKVFVYLWLHDKSCYYYTCLQNWLSYPIIVISTIASATILSSDNVIARYSVGSLMLLSAMLTTISRQIRPGEMQQQHAILTRKYHHIINSIDACLSLTAAMRPPADVFIERIGTDIDAMYSMQIEPPQIIINKFERCYGPLDSMLYGNDIIELVKADIITNRLFSNIKYADPEKTSSGDDTSAEDVRIEVANKNTAAREEYKRKKSLNLFMKYVKKN